MPVINGFPPNTSWWWLHHLVQRLMDQQSRYDKLEDYHIGNHPLPKADPKHVTAVKHFMKMAQTNYVTLINNAPVGRMKVRDFTFGEGGEPDRDAKKIWSVNDMDLQSKKLHSAASIFGDSYVLVGPVDETTGYPTMTVEDPRAAIVEPHPLFPTKSVAALRMWEDIVLNRIVAVLYLPESIHTFVGPFHHDYGGNKLDITNKLLGHSLGNSWEEVEVQDNELGEVPLVHFEWQPDYAGLSLGEAELVLHIQDRINQMILDRMVIASSQAFNQMWAAGVDLAPKKAAGAKKGPVEPPWELGPRNLWATDNKDAKFGQFDAVDFKQILEAVRDDIADIAAITQTPAHYLMNRMINVSGDTLTQGESGFVAKTKLRMDAMGWGWERAMRLSFRYMNLPKADEPEATVLWAKPMIRKDVDAADAASKWASLGIEPGLVMDAFGDFSSEQIAFAREHIEQQKREAEQMMEKQAAMAQANKAEETKIQKSPQEGK